MIKYAAWVYQNRVLRHAYLNAKGYGVECRLLDIMEAIRQALGC